MGDREPIPLFSPRILRTISYAIYPPDSQRTSRGMAGMQAKSLIALLLRRWIYWDVDIQRFLKGALLQVTEKISYWTETKKHNFKNLKLN